MFSTHTCVIERPDITNDDSGGSVQIFPPDGGSVVCSSFPCNLQTAAGGASSTTGQIIADFQRRGIQIHNFIGTRTDITAAQDGDRATINGLRYWVRLVVDAGGRGEIFQGYLQRAE